ncbi:MAG: hypothetical protein Q8R78_05020 [Candidatus Omnitrophota bacterium]|nr:hypothetical protein [Candidatus Omnitrophota bacterium]
MSRWLCLLGVFVVAGSLQVAQRTLIVLKGYGVGERLQQVHDREVALALLDTRVTGLHSPTHLARIANERQLKLVAWSRMDHALAAESGAPAPDARPAQLAAWDLQDDTAD